MNCELVVRNHHPHWRVDGHALRAITTNFLCHDLQLAACRLGIHVVGARTMERLNSRWLGHEGSTDVITFDHRDQPEQPMHGELFISVDDAAAHARRYRTTTAQELVRYVVHGVLHLRGRDDGEPSARRAMKREEDRWVRRLSAKFHFKTLVRRRNRRPESRVASRTS